MVSTDVNGDLNHGPHVTEPAEVTAWQAHLSRGNATRRCGAISAMGTIGSGPSSCRFSSRSETPFLANGARMREPTG